jgi:hypothetical protein
MKKILAVFTSLSISFVSCNNSETNEATSLSDSATNDKAVSKIALSSGCYSMIQQKDTAILEVDVVVDTNLSGRLQYRRFEKDDNAGVIDGVIRDGLIIADYTFQSEGRSSVRQIVLQIKGDSLFEGYGEIKVNGDTARFVDVSQLKFMTTPFVKVDCATQP